MTREKLLEKKISAISLGCDKNRVDLEKMLFRLKEAGFSVTADISDAQIVIVNTCAFILPAKEESISNIIEMEFLKKHKKIEKIVVTGCFPERNLQELKDNFSDVDKFCKLSDNDKIVDIIYELYSVKNPQNPHKNGRILTTPVSFAYLKIADGCNNVCSYCAIPRIRGRYRSEKMEDIVSEAEDLVKNGVKELILVAQDVTKYGIDIYDKPMLVPLLKKLCKIKKLEKIRLHYLYPESLSEDILKFIFKEPKVCSYIDLPLQHIDDKILKSMRRKIDEEKTRKLIEHIKIDYPDFALRTTFIVGYPGETLKQFNKLCRFIKEAKFDYAGFFPYYREENTSSFYMKHQVSEFIKKLRLKKIRKIQNKIYTEKAAKLIGTEVDVLIDEFDESTGDYLGHTEKLSPNTDFGVIVEAENLSVGDSVKVKILSFDGNNYKGVKL